MINVVRVTIASSYTSPMVSSNFALFSFFGAQPRDFDLGRGGVLRQRARRIFRPVRVFALLLAPFPSFSLVSSGLPLFLFLSHVTPRSLLLVAAAGIVPCAFLSIRPLSPYIKVAAIGGRARTGRSPVSAGIVIATVAVVVDRRRYGKYAHWQLVRRTRGVSRGWNIESQVGRAPCSRLVSII